MSAPASIEYRDVSKFYGDVLGVMNVSLTVEPGVTGLLGPNGAGKSTLIRLTMGLAAPDRGDVLIAGRSAWRNGALGAMIGYVNDRDHLPDYLTALDFVRLLIGFHGFGRREARRRAEAAIERVGLGDRMTKRIRTFSKGMRQRIKLAQALAHDPPILVLDEPLTGLDPVGRRAVIEIIEACGAAGRTVLVSSHVLHEIESMTERVALIRSGRVIASGGIRELRAELLQVPYRVCVTTPDAARLGAEAIALPAVRTVERTDDGVILSTTDVDGTLGRITELARDGGIAIEAITMDDVDLEALFRYTVEATR